MRGALRRGSEWGAEEPEVGGGAAEDGRGAGLG